MTPLTIPDDAILLGRHVRVPQHVVFRRFPTETVMLNLHSGRYHGLNPIGGEMLAALAEGASLHETAKALAERYCQPQAILERDICSLCGELLQRGLIELDDRPAP